MLLRKMLRDMKLNKTQFISIFLMTVLGLFIYSGVGSEWKGLQEISDEFYEETNIADAWIYSNDFSKEKADAIADIDEVTGVERRLTIDSIADFDNKPLVKLHFVEDNRISSFKLLEGEEFSSDQEGIWLDQLFAKAINLKVGDTIRVSAYGYSMDKVIKGLIISPEYVYSAGDDDIIPVRENYGYGYLPIQGYWKELPFAFTELMITTEHAMNSRLEQLIDNRLDGKYSVILYRKNLRSYMQFEEEVKEHKAMGKIFPVAFLAVALLTIITTMTRLVNNQRTQIGILKALGFKRRRILLHYISYSFWISVVGTVIGSILGPLTLPQLFYGPMKTTYTLPHWRSSFQTSVYVMVFLTIVGSVLATYFACRNVLQDTPSESLRPKAPTDLKHSFIDRLKLWRRLSFHTQWNLRDVFRCKGRSITAIVGVLGCSALLICAFGMQDTFDYIIEWNYGVINQYETKIDLDDNIEKDKLDNLKNKYGGQAVLEDVVELKANGKKGSGELLVTDNVTLINFVNQDRKEIELPNEQISISYKMAELLKIKKGDEISWHRYGEEKWNTSTVGAIYRTPFTQGITMSKEYYEDCGYMFQPTSLLSDKVLSEDTVSEASDDGIKKLQTKKMLIKSYNDLTEAMDVLVYVLMLAAATLAVVVIYNLGVLAFTERQRELATLKVIGFQTKKLRTLLLTQNIWLTLVGIIPGIPIGVWILNYIFKFMGNVFDFIIMVQFSSYLYCIFGTLFLSIIVNRFFSKRVKEIDMVSSLKGVE